MKVGDEVEWSSQANSRWRTKRGIIVAVVPDGKTPRDLAEWPSITEGNSTGPIDPRTLSRRGESYVVRVGRILYWPRVSVLRGFKTIPVLRDGRPATREEITAAIEGRPLPPAQLQPVLGPKHEGLRLDASGVLGRIRDGQFHDFHKFACGEMLRHLEEMAKRYYSGDIVAVDEFLQLYCLDETRPSPGS